jgi:hypothetical protein
VFRYTIEHTGIYHYHDVTQDNLCSSATKHSRGSIPTVTIFSCPTGTRYLSPLTKQFNAEFKKALGVAFTRRPPLLSSGESSWLHTQRSRVRFPALPAFLSSRGSETGSTRPL